MKEETLIKQYQEKYHYLQDNMEMVNILFDSQLLFLEKLEQFLFIDDNLINNPVYQYMEDMKNYKELLLYNSYNKYLINNNLNISKEQFINLITIDELFMMMEDHLNNESKILFNKNVKLKKLNIYISIMNNDNDIQDESFIRSICKDN